MHLTYEEVLASYLERKDAGETNCEADALRLYPEYDEQLRLFFRASDRFQHDFTTLADREDSHETDRPGLDDYFVVKEIGRGGMGTVFEAIQVKLGRRVALKVLHPQAALDDQRRARFNLEVRATAALDHPHIVPVHDVGEDKGIHYFSMKLIDGWPLSKLIHCWRDKGDRNTEKVPQFDPRVVVEWVIAVAESLDHAHGAGVIHRDVKPSNILIDREGKVWLTDFGLAHMQQDQALTTTGDVLGTVYYMSPELVKGDQRVPDPRWDIYALGITLYEALTWIRPFEGCQPNIVLLKIASVDPEPIRRYRPNVSWDLETIVMKSIQKEPRARYATAKEMADDLRRCLHGTPIAARRPSLRDRAGKWLYRRRRAAIGITGMMFVAITVALGSMAIHNNQLRTFNHELNAVNNQLQESRLESRRLLYLSDMTLALGAHRRGDIQEVQQILRRHIPDEAQPDYRGIEWWLLNSREERPIPQLLTEHTGPVRDIEVLSGNSEFVTCGDDGSVKQWALDENGNGRLQGSLQVANGDLHAVAVSPDRRWLAVASNEQSKSEPITNQGVRPQSRLGLWELPDRKWRRDLTQHDTTIEAITFSPKGDLVASGGRYGDIHVSDLNGVEVARFLGGERNETIAFSADGKRLFAQLKQETKAAIRSWPLESAEPAFDFADGLSRFRQFGVSQDGRCLVISDGTRPFLYNILSRNRIGATRSYAADIREVTFSPSANAIAAVYSDGKLRYWPLEKGWQRAGISLALTRDPITIPAHEGAATAISFLTNDRLVTTGEDGFIKVWGLGAPYVSVRAHLPQLGGDVMDVDPTRGEACVAGFDGVLHVIDLATGRMLVSFPVTANKASAVAYCPNGEWIAVGDENGLITCIDRNSGEIRSTIMYSTRNKTVNDIAFSTHGEYLAATGDDNNMSIWDTNSGVCLQSIPLPDRGRTVRFSPDGRRLVCGGVFSEVLVADMQPTGGLSHWKCEDTTHDICFGRDPSLCWTCHAGGVVRQWDLRTGIAKTRLASDADVLACALASDEQSLVTSHVDGTVRFWNLPHQTLIGTFFQDSGHVVARLTLKNDYLVIMNGRYETGDLVSWSIERNQNKMLPRGQSPDIISKNHESTN